MRVGVLLLLFSLSCAERQRGDDQLQSHEERPDLLTEQTTVQCDVWTELWELRDMVVEQKVKLQHCQTQITDLRDMVVEQKVKLQLKKENAETPKVAFSFGTGISGTYGPFNTDRILVLNREITNIGNAFSPITGVFTAPVKGVYYFRYTMSGLTKMVWTTIQLFKNQQSIVVTTKRPQGDHNYASNGATLLLEKGDQVYLKLLANNQIWDNHDNHFSFSGFMLFTM